MNLKPLPLILASIGGGVVVLAAVVAIILGSQAPTPPSGGDPTVDRFLAKVACETAVERELVAPASARYVHEVTGSGPWTVTGVVDSQNSFGATVRTGYRCSVSRQDGEMVATLERIG